MEILHFVEAGLSIVGCGGSVAKVDVLITGWLLCRRFGLRAIQQLCWFGFRVEPVELKRAEGQFGRELFYRPYSYSQNIVWFSVTAGALLERAKHAAPLHCISQ